MMKISFVILILQIVVCKFQKFSTLEPGLQNYLSQLSERHAFQKQNNHRMKRVSHNSTKYEKGNLQSAENYKVEELKRIDIKKGAHKVKRESISKKTALQMFQKDRLIYYPDDSARHIFKEHNIIPGIFLRPALLKDRRSKSSNSFWQFINMKGNNLNQIKATYLLPAYNSKKHVYEVNGEELSPIRPKHIKDSAYDAFENNVIYRPENIIHIPRDYRDDSFSKKRNSGRLSANISVLLEKEKVPSSKNISPNHNNNQINFISSTGNHLNQDQTCEQTNKVYQFSTLIHFTMTVLPPFLKIDGQGDLMSGSIQGLKQKD